MAQGGAAIGGGGDGAPRKAQRIARRATLTSCENRICAPKA